MSWGTRDFTSTVLAWGEDSEESEVVFVVIDASRVCLIELQ